MSLYQLILIIIFAILVAVFVVLFLPVGQGRDQKSLADEGADTAPIDRQDPHYWFGGLLYNNPDDPDLLVPKRFGLGWTVNFGHPGSKVFLAIVIMLMLLPIVIAIFDPGFAASGCHPTTSCHF